jgi:exonuclease III
VRGLNSEKKWNSIRDKIVESKCDIVCLQETKKEQFDSTFIRNICPQHFDSFTFKPSQGASGGILVCWNGRIFNGVEIF